MSINSITAEELMNKIHSGLPADECIVDVRTPGECAKGMIQGATNIPVQEIATHIASLAPYKTIHLYCLSGGRSDLALLELQSSGIQGTVYSLQNGILGWRAAGYPLTTA